MPNTTCRQTRCSSTCRILCNDKTQNTIKKEMEAKNNRIVIAIDGFSSCGKSTMAKDLAKDLGYIYVDTGAMYRSVTLYAMRHGMFAADNTIDTEALQKAMPEINISFRLNTGTGRPDTYLNGECVEKEIRSMEVSSHVSPIAALPFVRQALVRQQQEMGKEKGIVMDGRDIGTVVLPNEEVKIFLTATPEARATRRYKELMEKGMDVKYGDILQDVITRDYNDSHREIAPLKQADDAVLADTTEIDLQGSIDLIVSIIKERM